MLKFIKWISYKWGPRWREMNENTVAKIAKEFLLTVLVEYNLASTLPIP